jgi:TolB protein
MDADGRNVRQLTRDRRGARTADTQPDWSPDGRRIAFASNRAAGELELYVMSADGGNVRRITHTKPFVIDADVVADGKLIAFASTRAAYFNSELCVVRPDGSGVRRLTHTAGSDDRPQDEATPVIGHRMGSGSRSRPNRDRQQEIYVMDADGTHQRRLTRVLLRDDILPRWSPVGGTIAFVSTTIGPSLAAACS